MQKKADRKLLMQKWYREASLKNETVQWACHHATKEVGYRVNKNEMQYWAMKNGHPYLDEVGMDGIRKKIT
jgi:hypothetical protein